MGHITRRESKDVVRDVMHRCGVPSSVWHITPSGDVNLLIGERKVVFICRSKMTYYELKLLEKKIEAAAVEYRNRPDPRQIDLEDAVNASVKLETVRQLDILMGADA